MFFRAGIHKMLVRIANREYLIRLLLQKVISAERSKSDLGLHSLSRAFVLEILECLP